MSKSFNISERKGHFSVDGLVSEEEIIAMAKNLIAKRFKRGIKLTNPQDTREYLSSALSHYEHEVFSAIFLDSQHRILAYEEMFKGTIDGATVHPREVAKRALQLNAAALILAHNHPSGTAEPSSADQRITSRLKEALGLVDIRVLDHIVVGGTETVSMAERGMIVS